MKRLLKIYMEKPELAALLLLVVLIFLFQSRSGGLFITAGNLRGVFGILPEMALVAIGVTVLMICGEFDLSVGAVFALMPMTVAVLMTHDVPFSVALAAGLLVCVAIGFLNGFLTIQFAIPSFITTLGMMFVARSLTVVVSGGFPPLLSADLPTWLFVSFVGPGELFRMSFIWFVAVAILVSLLLSRTNFGNWVRATGGFLPAANAMGIPTARVKIACFILCSVLSGFAGLIQVLRLGSPLPSIGEGMELQAVAAAVIGGTALTGGIGAVLGGIIGVALIRVIDNGLILSQVDANWFKFAIGSLTIFAVIANSWLRKRAKAIKVEV
ncbi:MULTISPECIES: ABC transporter permease [unclassified Rhizobium]|jgi:simple sugar transport system permease protein|uniref:ABC transporter permease n=1 Tax=unclassified Rhizobium TaxID=2613769 RepID=UPI001469F244|nr:MULTISPECIES: ABC transporter permease [unclassified Rhizobium]MBD9445111.1 ABC transporter permease [Rhizobium sp. RHZ01]MBD9454425.1 ABC transporter permease [Rhizobium sp. RHZ02]NMN71406.1 simple sugar transport system permease protein [Rhizobium sp. 57MFTsu3.2]